MEITCPRCKKPTFYEGNPHRPFCSERCKTIDFGNWASQKYGVPAEDSITDQSQQDSEDDDSDKPKQK